MIYKVLESCELEIDDEKILSEIQSIQSDLKELKEGTQTSTEATLTRADAAKLNKIQEQIDQLKAQKARELRVTIEDRNPVELGLQHEQFETLLRVLASGLNAYVVGPTGSGKTTAAVNVAKAMGLEFYFTGAIASEFKLTGFIDAQGRIVNTEFRRAYEKGGLFLFDEIDASYPQAVLAFNAALANDFMDFPDKRVARHKDFRCIAAANTYGMGADRVYVGRNQLDAASLDRFVFLDWHYDEKLERAIAGHDTWVDFVQDVRRAVQELKIRHVVSPRASIFGVQLLKYGMPAKQIIETLIWKGLDQATIEKIKKNLRIEVESTNKKRVQI